MKLSGFWVSFLVLQTSLLVLHFSSIINASSTWDMAPNCHHVESNECLSAKAVIHRKLKLQDIEKPSSRRKKVFTGDLNLDDYHPVDPVPSSKTSIKPGPIEHGSPIIPYIPNPSPPDQPQPGDLS